MKIMYIASMFHTNQAPVMKGWADAGDQALFVCHTKGITENHTYCKPLVLGFAGIFNVINFIYKKYQKKFNPYTSFPEAFEGKYGFPSPSKFIKVMRKFQPELVILRDRSAYSVTCYLVCQVFKIPCVLYNQTPYYEANPLKKDILHRIAYKLSPEVRMTPVFGSQTNTYINGKSYYVPFVIETVTAPSERIYFNGDQINILSVGKFEERKNHILLLKVILKLSEFYPIKLTLVGEVSTEHHRNYLKKVNQYIKKYKLENIVSIVENVPPYNMATYYKSADLFILPSTKEYASFSQMEAMAHSVPAIVSETNGTACYIQEGYNGFLFHDNDLEDLLIKIEKVIKNKEILLEMGTNAYNRIKDCYSFETYKNNIEKLYKECIRER